VQPVPNATVDKPLPRWPVCGDLLREIDHDPIAIFWG